MRQAATQNTFLGFQAGFSNTGGQHNTFNGVVAGFNNITGSGNTFNGYFAGGRSTGDYNTFIGYETGFNNTTGSSNVYIKRHSPGWRSCRAPRGLPRFETRDFLPGSRG